MLLLFLFRCLTVQKIYDDLQMIEDYFSYGIIKPLPNADVMAECNVKVKSLKEALKHINKNI